MIHRTTMALVLALTLFASSGHAEDDAGSADGREPYRDPTWAAVRGALVPGSVHMQLGEPDRGTVFLVGAVLSLPFALGVVDFPLLDDPDFSKAIGVGAYAMFAGVSAYEAVEITDRLNRENGHLLDDDLAQARGSVGRGVRITLVRARF